MDSELMRLDFIDLLSERHVRLRMLCEKLWNENHQLYISNSEWFIIARIYKLQPTISQVTKQVDISRQATHKIIKSLEAKGLVEVRMAQHNKKERCLQLTPFGESSFEEHEKIKATLERKITETIGSEHVNQLKKLLQLDWGV